MSVKRGPRTPIALLDYVTPAGFRTVDSLQCPGSPSELPVELSLKDAFQKELSFPTPWDGLLHGYLRRTPAFDALCGESGLPAEQVSLVWLEDWDDYFLLFLEGADGKRETAFQVSRADLRALLEGCQRIPAQQSLKGAPTIQLL